MRDDGSRGFRKDIGEDMSQFARSPVIISSRACKMGQKMGQVQRKGYPRYIICLLPASGDGTGGVMPWNLLGSPGLATIRQTDGRTGQY